MTTGNPTEHILDRLAETVAARRGSDPSSSYTAKLLAAGPVKAAQKVGEEAVETVIEAARGNLDGLASESADLLYHLTVLWAAAGLDPARVWAELERREGTSGLAEKASRTTPSKEG
ncbi:phosphoribosyl-ATP diphosphatase [Thalassobaculum sp.]|uniref:phosphoribosyl-ATP diphosphatase n=1 Tax=Thalassobaculum sp. TaxID=2022740 RepID=UPI0032F05952